MKAAFFDVDGTLTTIRVWKGLMEYFRRRDLRRVTHLAFLAAHYPLYFVRRLRLISESAFRAPWAAHLAWYLRGYTPEQAQKVWDWIVTEFLVRHWRADSRALIDEHLAAGDLVMLVSSGPRPLIQRIAQELGAEHAIGTNFEIRDGHYTGRSLYPICIDEYKATLTQAYLHKEMLNVDLDHSYSYADSIADLQLLEMVAHPVAVYPDENLRKIALQRGWKIFPS
jgi:HAD superfamily hydrolase (TIGR01490 family)